MSTLTIDRCVARAAAARNGRSSAVPVYSDPRTPEPAIVVREGDCVLMPGGYHRNVAAPGGPTRVAAGSARQMIAGGTRALHHRGAGAHRVAPRGARHCVRRDPRRDDARREVVLVDIFTPIREDFLTT